MARYADDAKEKVRDAVDFVALVGAKTELRRTSGSGFMGICPFHDERTPSFSVDAAKKVFHCFGCGESGDVYRFVELTEGVDFKGALELLADRHGVELEAEDADPQAAERRERRKRLLELLERTSRFYERYLWESKEAARAREYLAGRGLEEATLREFRVGYSPSAWDTVLKSTQRAGFKARELYDAGLAQRSQGSGRVYDRFRARIMFPLADLRGRVVGFGARQLGDNRGPKYLNTSENEIFHKGRIVYASHLARSHAAKASAVIVCEGYTDVLALHQAGVRNAIASMGTALTEDQLVELGRMAPTLQLMLDADDAGQDAMLRAAKVAAGRKLELRVVPLPEGRDPAEVALEEGADAVRALVAKSVPFVRFRVERTLRLGNLSSPEGKDQVIAELRPAFATIGPSILQEELMALVADRLDIGADLARRLIYGGNGRGAGPAAPRGGEAPRVTAPGVPARVSRSAQTERGFLALCTKLPAEGARALADVDPERHFTDRSARAAASWLKEHLAAPLDGLDEADEELAAVLREILGRAASLDDVPPAVVEFERLRLELALVDRQLASPGELSRTDLARRRGELRAEIDSAMERSLG